MPYDETGHKEVTYASPEGKTYRFSFFVRPQDVSVSIQKRAAEELALTQWEYGHDTVVLDGWMWQHVRDNIEQLLLEIEQDQVGSL